MKRFNQMILRFCSSFMWIESISFVVLVPGPQNDEPSTDMFFLTMIFGVLALLYAFRPNSFRRTSLENKKAFDNAPVSQTITGTDHYQFCWRYSAWKKKNHILFGGATKTSNYSKILWILQASPIFFVLAGFERRSTGPASGSELRLPRAFRLDPVMRT